MANLGMMFLNSAGNGAREILYFKRSAIRHSQSRARQEAVVQFRFLTGAAPIDGPKYKLLQRPPLNRLAVGRQILDLVGAVLEASTVDGAERFLTRLADNVALTAERGNVHPWYRVLLRLREQVTPHWYASGHLGTEVEALFTRAYAVIDERAELAEALRLQAREDLMLQLHETSREARMALDWTALCGVLIPLILRRLSIDPALAGGVILTTVTDCCGFASFLGLSTLLLLR